MKKQLEELKQELRDLDEQIKEGIEYPEVINAVMKKRISLQGEIIYLTALISTQS